MIKAIPTREPGTIHRSDRGRWTYGDLQELGETQDRYEIINGGLFMSPSADLVMEVLSPASVRYDREAKFGVYGDFGVKEYWGVDPEARQIDVFSRRRERLEEVGRFEDGDQAQSALLDGFAADVSAVFS